jgi:hypothetical protein
MSAATDTLAELHLNVVKRCACGRAYELADWRQLERKGLQMCIEQDACLDLRACAGCGSCLALPMQLIPAPEVES